MRALSLVLFFFDEVGIVFEPYLRDRSRFGVHLFLGVMRGFVGHMVRSRFVRCTLAWFLSAAQTRATIDMTLFGGNVSRMTGRLNPKTLEFHYYRAAIFVVVYLCHGIFHRVYTRTTRGNFYPPSKTCFG